MKGLKRHQLMEPVENLEGRMCMKHDKHLELFCKTDQMCLRALLCFRPQEPRVCSSELMKRSSEVEQLSRSEDHLHLLQSFSSLKAAPPTKDWTEVSVHPSYEGTVVRVVAQLEERLREDMKKLFEAELKRVQQYAVDVTLDPDTAHPELILSDDGKQVTHGGEKKKLPDNPERFSYSVCVLGTQSFSSGRFYFEVQVKGKTDWDLGVATETISGKKITLSPQEVFWTAVLKNGNEYKALDDPSVHLSLQSAPEKVGVFVEYDEGLV